MRFGLFDSSGIPLGFYSSQIHGALEEPIYGEAPEPTEVEPNPVAPVIGRTRNPAIPAGAIPITDEQWRDLMQNPGARRWTPNGVERIQS